MDAIIKDELDADSDGEVPFFLRINSEQEKRVLKTEPEELVADASDATKQSDASVATKQSDASDATKQSDASDATKLSDASDATKQNEKQRSKSGGKQTGSGVTTTISRKPFTCDICGIAFKYSAKLSQHKNVHVKKALSKTAYVKPMKIEPSREYLQYRCTQCRIGFSELLELSKHIRKAKLHDRKFDMYECSICGLSFSGFPSLPAIKNHIKTHTGVHPVDVTIQDTDDTYVTIQDTDDT